jgi:hypothetical protein
MKSLAALYVDPTGPYSNLPGVDPWDEARDARQYAGPHPVIAHPPCQRWGRYWSGGPSAKVKRIKGDDGGCFEAALASVRHYGGWTDPDQYGGRSCCVAQGNYGHAAQKLTWLYAVLAEYPELVWGLSPGKLRMDEGFHSAEHRRRAIRTGVCQRLSKRQRILTPLPFRDALLALVQTNAK